MTKQKDNLVLFIKYIKSQSRGMQWKTIPVKNSPGKFTIETIDTLQINRQRSESSMELEGEELLYLFIQKL